MNNLSFLTNLWRLFTAKKPCAENVSALRSRCTDVSLDRRLTVGSPSGLTAIFSTKFSFKFVAVLCTLLTIGVGQSLGTDITLNSTNLGVGSYSADEATADVGNVTFSYVQLMKSNSTYDYSIQSKASAGELWNSSLVPGKITSVAFTKHSSSTNRSSTIYWGNSAKPSSSTTTATFSGTSTQNAPANNCFGYFYVLRGSNAAYWTQVVVTYTPATITLGSTSVSGLDYAVGNGPSSAGSFTVSGSNIPANLKVTAPTNFEVSTDGGSTWGTEKPISVTLTGASAGTLNTTTVKVRLASGKSAGDYDGNVSIAMVGCNTITNVNPKSVAVSGTVSAASCSSNPTVSGGSLKGSVSSTTSATAQCTSGISSLGSAGCSITSYGFAVGTSTGPIIGSALTGTGKTYQVGTTYATKDVGFEGTIDGLSAGTKYYVRPYATNGNGTAYGSEFNFTTLHEYTLTYKETDGTGNGSGKVVENATSFTNTSAPSKVGHTLEGFYTSSGLSTKVASNERAFVASVTDWTGAGGKYTKGANADLYLKWTPASYTITTTLTNCSWSSAISSPYTYDGATDAITRTVNPSSGYGCPSSITVTMGGSTLTQGTDYTWSVTNNVGSFTLNKAITGNVAITINATAVYTVTFTKGTGTCATASLTEPFNGQGVTLPTPTHNCDGWSFAGWTTGSLVTTETGTAPATLLTGGSNYKPASNITLYAVYQKGDGKYKLITSTPASIPGKYMIVKVSSSTAGVALKNATQATYFMAGEAVSISSNEIAANTSSNLVWDVTVSNSKWVIKNGSNYLYNYGTGTYWDLGITSTTKNGYTVTFNGSGYAILTSADDARSNTYIKYVYYNSTTHEFMGAASSDGTYNINLFKKDLVYYSNPSCKDVKSIAVKTAPTKTTYCEGAYFDPTALVITVTYDDDTYEDIGYSGNEAKFTFSPTTATALTTSHTSVSITYGGKSTSQSITVNTLRTIARAGSPAGTVTGGTFTVDNASACVGATITLTATPSSHYSLSSWTITKTSDGTDVTSSVSISGSSSSPATFTMPDYNVTVNATFTEDAYRTVVFKNNSVALFNDGGSATTFDGTNKWKQKVYLTEKPVWPTDLVALQACDGTSTSFMGWVTSSWSGKESSGMPAGKTLITAASGFDAAEDGSGDVVYHAVWAKATAGSSGSFSITASDITTGPASYTESETTFTKLSTDDIGYKNVSYNNKNTPSDWAAQQRIQFKKDASTYGELYNKVAIDGLTKIRIYDHSGSSNLTIYTGTTSKATTTTLSWPGSATGTEDLSIPKSSSGTLTFTSSYYDLTVSNSHTFFYIKNGNTAIAYPMKVEVFYAPVTYSEYLTTCCDYNVTLSDGSPSNGTVSFSPAGPIATCSATASDRTTTMTITPSTGYYLSDYTSSGVSTSNSPSIATSGSTSEAAQEISLVFAQNTTSGTYTAGATFSQIPVSGWSFTNHRGGAAITDEALVVYVGQKVQLDITYSPANAHADHKAKEQYSQTSVSTYILSPTKASAYFTFTCKASTSGNTTTIALTHNDGPTKDVNVEVRPLPSDTYLDLIHGVVFANQTASLSDSNYGVDFSYTAPGSTTPDWTGSYKNDCEEVSEHLIGWIDSEWADKHLGDIPTTSEVTAAKLDDGTTPAFHASGASMTAANRTYYAVWAKEVE